MEKLKVRAVIFDLGCTLIEYEALGWDELAKEAIRNGHQLLSKRGVAVPDYETFYETYASVRDQFRQQAIDTLQEWSIPKAVRMVFERLSVTYDNDLVDKFFDAYYKPVAESLFLYDDVPDGLEFVRDNFEVVGLISNTIFPEKTHRLELMRFGIDQHFDFEIFSSSFGLRKPHKDIFYQAVNYAGYSPKECVYIGDRYPEDVLGPTSIGMHSILRHKDGREYPEKRPEAFAEIQTLAELPEILQN